MNIRNKKLAGMGLALASVLALGGCYDDGYGYGGVSAGYGSGGYYDDYYGYGYPGYGWYDGFYYPGRGYYIYDRDGRRHHWDDHHRRHWEGQQGQRDHGNWRGNGNWRDHGNWQGMNHTPRGNWRDRSPGNGQSGGRGGGHWSRGGESGAATDRPAPGPMGHVFRDRGRRDQ